MESFKNRRVGELDVNGLAGEKQSHSTTRFKALSTGKEVLLKFWIGF